MSGGCVDGQLRNNATTTEIDGRRVMYTDKNGFLSISSNYAQNISNISSAFWLNIQSRNTTSYIFYIESTTNSGSQFKIKFFYKSGKTWFTVWGLDWKYGFQSKVLPQMKLNEWIHVGVVCEVKLGVKLYINGCLVREGYETLSPLGFSYRTQVFLYGRKRRTMNSLTPTTNVYFDDIHIWKDTVPNEYFYILYNEKIISKR